MDHEFLSRDHSEIDRLFAEARAAIGNNEDALALVDLLWARLAVHIRAEHLHVFPALTELAERSEDSETVKTIANLRADHDFFMKEFASIVKKLRLDPLSDVIKDPLDQIARRLASHNIVEENQIYPLIDERLADDVRDELIRRAQAELDKVPSRFPEADWRRTE